MESKDYQNFANQKTLTALKLKDQRRKQDLRQTMGAVLVADNFVNKSVFDEEDARINTLLEETFQLTVRQRMYDDAELATNQSCIADIAVQCETRRHENHNYRLDLETPKNHEYILERQQTLQKMQRGQLPLSLARVLFTIVCDRDFLQSMFSYSDIMRLSQTSKSVRDAIIKTKALKKSVRFGNLDCHLRKKFWLAQIDKDKLQAKVKEMTGLSDGSYSQITAQIKSNPEERISSRVRDEIEKDLNRTNTCERVQTPRGQDELRMVLLAAAFCLPDVGYCQGMNFIASVLIAVTDSEEVGFTILMHMLITLEMRAIFLPGVPELHLKNFQIGQLMKFHLPKFLSHMRQLQASPDYFTSKWFMTIFACFLPFRMVVPIFDMFLHEGWKSVFKIGIALLKVMEPTLLQMEMWEMSQYFRDKVRVEGVPNQAELFQLASRIRIHNKELEKLREKFYIIQAQVKLETSDTWHEDQKNALSRAKLELQKMDPHARDDICKFQEKLAKIDKDLERHSKNMVGINLDYIAIREEFNAMTDKFKAYEETYKDLSQQVQKKEERKQSRLKSFLGGRSEPSNNQNNCYRLPNDKLIEESDQQRQLQQDLRDLGEKLAYAKTQCAILKPDYKTKKRAYFDAKEKLEELIQYKQKVKDQMVGFIKMIEVKKEATLQELSHKLQESDSFQRQNVF